MSGYLEGTDLYEVLYSPRRGYSVFRWDADEGRYYGERLIHRPEDLADFVYQELMSRLTLETGSDHTAAAGDLDDAEAAEARAVTEKYLQILPPGLRDTFLKKRDPETGLLKV